MMQRIDVQFHELFVWILPCRIAVHS